jgi:hypothetical protein
MQLPKVASSKVHRYLSDPRFKKEFDHDYQIDRSCDVPYVAGYSINGRTVFVDRHFKKMMGKIDVEPYIFVHEKCEKALIDTFGLKYQDAHHIATHLERMTIARDGINWDRYEKFVINQYKHIGHEKIQKIPHNLDLTPYKDEKDFKLLRQLQK